MPPVIKVENLSKAYQIGQFGTGTISRDIERWWVTKVLGKEDPFLKIGQTNDRSTKGDSDIVWSLKDINFEVEQGDAVGIIGKNGAGKSTLLKILSRVTAPTTGTVKVKGRIASLLEVGTGFHPELTGRENIYLNGAILGMRKHEITRKLDEIIDFSGVERYIDTPVKRYSSGMYVRLAFAVAAHLESEILIVDEVLAVGDAEFQKKCLGKMGEVSKGEGRTVLFVSHNMESVSKLCKLGILLMNGEMIKKSTTDLVISEYLKTQNSFHSTEWRGEINDPVISVFRTWVTTDSSQGNYLTSDLIIIGIDIEIYKQLEGMIIGFSLYNSKGVKLLYSLYDDHLPPPPSLIELGRRIIEFEIPPNTLAVGRYKIEFDIGIHNVRRIVKDECNIEFNLNNISGIGRRFISGHNNIFRPNLKISNKILESQ